MKSFSFEIRDEVILIQLHQKLDATNSPELQEYIVTEGKKSQSLIFDFGACPYISSAGIRVLIVARKQVAVQHGFVYLSGLQPGIRQVLEMAGLYGMFEVFDELGECVRTAGSRRATSIAGRNALVGDIPVSYLPSGNLPLCHLWASSSLAHYREAEFSLGNGCPVEAAARANQHSLFLKAGDCLAFADPDNPTDIDFFVPENPAKSAIRIHQAVSFPLSSLAGLLIPSISGSISPRQLEDFAASLLQNPSDAESLSWLAIGINNQPGNPSISISGNSTYLNLSKPISYRIVLDEFSSSPADPLDLQLKRALSFENISGITPESKIQLSEHSSIHLFLANHLSTKQPPRLTVETSQGVTLSDESLFLIRNLYTDAARILVEGLHGGFSAQTFQVLSFDTDDRKMRPTVLKIANRAMIKRESERCQQFALPYIFNNSAVVLGAEFLGDTGALRYNFVGVGGTESKLKWLTHYYHQSPPEFLIPLFDKIFLDILKPWYGQAVPGEVKPFAEHDPTETFFPFIYDVAFQLYGLSPENQFFTDPLTGLELLNPYWFLKNEYKRLKTKGINYYIAVCHGDLNMQNILVDEKLNVYLIDFSETKLRSVVSDFARLEAIFLIDNAPVESDEELKAYFIFLENLYQTKTLPIEKETDCQLINQERFSKNLQLVKRMREYAVSSAHGTADVIPYYFALLEWVLPIICYTVPDRQKKAAMLASSILCQCITDSDFYQ